MMFSTPWTVTPEHRNTVLQLFKQQSSISGEDVRSALRCTSESAHTVIEDLISQGLIETEAGNRNTTRYLKKEFEHDLQAVREDWFPKLEAWFAGGKADTVISVASQLKLPVKETKATLEEMRKRGILFGKFVGKVCIYSAQKRGQLLQASEVQMDQIINSPEKKLRDSMEEASQPRGRRARG